MADIQFKARSTGDQACDLVREQILAGSFAPGEALREVELSRRLGISRNTLREVLHRLVDEGMVLRSPHRGVRVADPQPEDVEDIFLVRTMLEPAGLARLGRVEGDAVRDLQRTVERLERDASARDWVSFAESESSFHGGLVARLGSERLSRLHTKSLRELRLAFIHIDRTAHRQAPTHVAEHRRILELVLAGEGEEAESLLVEHLEASKHMVLDLLGVGSSRSVQTGGRA